MPEVMKDKYYNCDSLHQLAVRIKAVYPSFQVNNFIGDIMEERWESLELKARMRQAKPKNISNIRDFITGKSRKDVHKNTGFSTCCNATIDQ